MSQQLLYGSADEVDQSLMDYSREGWQVVPGTLALFNRCSTSIAEFRPPDKNGLTWQIFVCLVIEKRE